MYDGARYLGATGITISLGSPTRRVLGEPHTPCREKSGTSAVAHFLGWYFFSSGRVFSARPQTNGQGVDDYVGLMTVYGIAKAIYSTRR